RGRSEMSSEMSSETEARPATRTEKEEALVFTHNGWDYRVVRTWTEKDGWSKWAPEEEVMWVGWAAIYEPPHVEYQQTFADADTARTAIWMVIQAREREQESDRWPPHSTA